MDLVFVVIWCNCTIAIGCLVISVFCFRLRRQLVALTECCDRWTIDCDRLLANAPQSLANSRKQIRQLRQFYRQQAVTVDRLQAIGLFIGILRSLLLAQRVKGKG